MIDQPLLHLTRPKPPWAMEDKTECGRPSTDVARIGTVEDLRTYLNKYGQRRAEFDWCQTCLNRIRHVSLISMDWSFAAVTITKRWLGDSYRTIDDQQDPVFKQVIALAALVERHRDEYEALVAQEGTVNLAEHRQQRKDDHA